jgi:hypothetical protein
MHQRATRTVLTAALLAGAVIHASAMRASGQTPDWMPTVDTHAWSRFGVNAYKEVRVRKYVVRKDGEVLQSSTLARTRVTRVGPRSYTLCVSSVLELGGDEAPSAPQNISRDVAPAVTGTTLVGEQQITIDGRPYKTQEIRYTTTTGSQVEQNTVFICKDTTPQVLKRVTKSVDATNEDMATETISTVTALGGMADILCEPKCTWSTTTVIKMRDKTVTIREVNCAEVPGELVSQTTEEHDANGVLIARKELELIGCSSGRPRRLFHRRDKQR